MQYKPNNDDTFNVNIEDIKANKPDDDLQALIDATDDMVIHKLTTVLQVQLQLKNIH